MRMTAFRSLNAKLTSLKLRRQRSTRGTARLKPNSRRFEVNSSGCRKNCKRCRLARLRLREYRDVALRGSPVDSTSSLAASQTEVELNEKLFDTLQKLQQAGAEKQETEKEAKFKETLASLKRAFPGECPCIGYVQFASSNAEQSMLSRQAFEAASLICADQRRRSMESP